MENIEKKDESLSPKFRNAKFVDSEKTRVFCEIQLEENGEWLPWGWSRNAGDSEYTTKAFEQALANGLEVASPDEVDLALEKDKKAAEIRDKRNADLSATDVFMISDYPLTVEQAEAVRSYRAALRDLTKQDGFPDKVKYPEKPDFIR